MKRQRVELEDLSSWNNLQLALWKATRGKRQRPDVVNFYQHIDSNLLNLQKQLLNGELPLQSYRSFRIRDPKPRKIVAVSFELRVLHHAIMNIIGANLEKSQIETSFACLPNRGAHRAVKHVQRGLRRFRWFVKIDIEHYFENVDHQCLKDKLNHRFKGREFLALLDAVIDSYQEQPGKGLPIGSLTSQYFANFYLEHCDRFIQKLPDIGGYVRYMDDMIWFTNSRQGARKSLRDVVDFIGCEKLKVKAQRQIQPAWHGVHYCGYRILPYSILLSRRKKRLYLSHLKRWQECWKRGEISASKLQNCYDSIHGSTTIARSAGYRRIVLAKTGLVEV